MSNKKYLVCCSVFKDEIDTLSVNKEFEVVFLGMTLHSDYKLLEENLRKILKNCAISKPNKIVLVYGDHCLGLNGEMKEIVKEFSATKVDAINCIDCFLGGKGNYLKADPEQKLIFLFPGWIKYFNLQLQKGTTEEKKFMKTLFTGFNGIILLDTTGNLDNYEDQIQNFVNYTGLKIVKTRKLNANTIKNLINQA